MTVVLEKVHINNMEMCIKILTGSMPLIFDKTRPGMSKFHSLTIIKYPRYHHHLKKKCLTITCKPLDIYIKHLS